MVSPCHRRRLILAIAPAALLLCQCETTRTVKSTRSSFSFDDQMWGGQGGGSDNNEIRSKFAERGYTIGEDGKIKADNPDLYKGATPRGLDGEFGTKQAKLGNREARTKEFKKPEYLKRQEFAGVSRADESGAAAREGDFRKSKESGKLFERKSESSTSLASYETGTDEATGSVFATGRDEIGTEAIDNAPRPRGNPQTMGYRDNASMTMDDVKKLLNPGSYARAAELDQQ